MLHQCIYFAVRIIKQGNRSADNFAQIVRRNIGCHPNRNTGRTVNQQVRNLGGQHVGNVFGAVIIRRKINSLFIKIRQQVMSNPCHTNLGISHGCGSIPIDRTKIALPVYQGVA